MASANLAPAFREFVDDAGVFTFACSSADVAVGDAVSLDASADMTVKWAPDGGEIYGRVQTVENRAQSGTLLVAVATRFMGRLKLKASETPAVGDTVVGAGNGQVKVRAQVALTGDAQNVDIGNQKRFSVVSTAENTAGFTAVQA